MLEWPDFQGVSKQKKDFCLFRSTLVYLFLQTSNSLNKICITFEAIEHVFIYGSFPWNRLTVASKLFFQSTCPFGHFAKLRCQFLIEYIHLFEFMFITWWWHFYPCFKLSFSLFGTWHKSHSFSQFHFQLYHLVASILESSLNNLQLIRQ